MAKSDVDSVVGYIAIVVAAIAVGLGSLAYGGVPDESRRQGFFAAGLLVVCVVGVYQYVKRRVRKLPRFPEAWLGFLGIISCFVAIGGVAILYVVSPSIIRVDENSDRMIGAAFTLSGVAALIFAFQWLKRSDAESG